MLKIPYEEVIAKIKEESGISDQELDQKIQEKLKQLSGLISKEGAAHIIANELGVKIFDQISGKMKVEKLLTGMRDVEVIGKIIQVYEVREFQRKEGTGKVGSLLVGDETGVIRIVCWGDQADMLQQMQPDNVIRVLDAYVKDNNGRKEVHCNDKTSITINPPGLTVGEIKRVQEQGEAKRKEIKDLQEGDNNVELLGTIVQAFEPRFFEVCPECGKRARMKEGSWACEQHNQVTPDYSYLMNLFLDDGSENIRVVLFRNQVAELLGKTKEELLAYKDNPATFDNVKMGLLGEIIKLTGRVQRNAMFDRIEFVSTRIDPKPNPEEELKRMEASAQ